jgi:NitT/TauT family transport system ATP-binding protein
MSQPFITLNDVTLRYGAKGGNGTLALDNTNLQIDQGDFVALVGPSGCGKSTILKLVAKLLQPSSGGVVVRGREAGAPALPENRLRIGLAFQNPSMLPWLTIRQNVMVPLKIVHPFRADYAKKKHGEYAERA